MPYFRYQNSYGCCGGFPFIWFTRLELFNFVLPFYGCFSHLHLYNILCVGTSTQANIVFIWSFRFLSLPFTLKCCLRLILPIWCVRRIMLCHSYQSVTIEFVYGSMLQIIIFWTVCVCVCACSNRPSERAHTHTSKFNQEKRETFEKELERKEEKKTTHAYRLQWICPQKYIRSVCNTGGSKTIEFSVYHRISRICKRTTSAFCYFSFLEKKKHFYCCSPFEWCEPKHAT